jgi:ubiquinone/menaquinone biosynthesis C-methylase UbiE
MQNRLILPVNPAILLKDRELRLSQQQRAMIDWAKVDDHQAILDTNCGDGRLLAHYVQHYTLRACGMVYDADQQLEADSRLDHQAEILRAARTDIPWRNDSFHATFVAGPAISQPEMLLFLKEVHRVLLPKGQLLAAFPCIPLITRLGIKGFKSPANSIINAPYTFMEQLEVCGFTDISMRVTRMKFATIIAYKEHRGTKPILRV